MALEVEKTRDCFVEDVSRSTAVRSCRVTVWFAGVQGAQAALKFASARHANQYRATDHSPFIAHPIEVGWLLFCDGQQDEVIVAGLLHDVLEKTTATPAELRRRFGARIARLVESVSDDPSIDDCESRKRELLDRVARGDAGTWAIFAADKISKVRELARLPLRHREGTKNRAELTHYRASLTVLRQVAADLALVDSLETELNRLVVPGIPGTQVGHHKGPSIREYQGSSVFIDQASYRLSVRPRHRQIHFAPVIGVKAEVTSGDCEARNKALAIAERYNTTPWRPESSRSPFGPAATPQTRDRV